jgi:phosphoglycolate phosphatase
MASFCPPAAPPRKRRDDPAAVARHLINKDYDAVCFDCDGVLWKGDALVTPLVPTLLEQLRRRSVAYVFFTNNSLRARADYAKKFAKLGLGELVPADLIFSSSYAAAAFLRRREQQREAAAAAAAGDKELQQPPPPPAAKKKKAYVIGGQGIIEELRLAGFDAFGGPQDGDKRVDFASEVAVDRDVFAVVVGVDPLLNYFKIHYAALCLLQNPGCLFLACNEDSRGHFSPNQEWPGAGASVASVAAVVGRRPDAVVGKPSTFMAREVVEALRERRKGTGAGAGCGPRVLMVGDRLDTDVAWAHAAADEMERGGGGGGGGRRPWGALLVMSGVATDADLQAWPGRAPEFVLGDVGELAEALVAAAAAEAED